MNYDPKIIKLSGVDESENGVSGVDESENRVPWLSIVTVICFCFCPDC